jgi:hypothetical protein
MEGRRLLLWVYTNRCERLTESVHQVENYRLRRCRVVNNCELVGSWFLFFLLLFPIYRPTSPLPSHSFMCVHLAGLSGEQSQ